CRIFNGKSRVQCRRPLVERSTTVPFVGATLGVDDDRSRRCPARVGVFVGGANREFLNRVRRKILQKSANPVVGVVAAVHGKIIVQSGTSSGGNRRDP